MKTDTSFTRIANVATSDERTEARSALARSLDEITAHMRERTAFAAGERNPSFEALENLATNLLYCYKADAGGQNQLGFVRVRTRKIADGTPELVFADEWYGITRERLGRPYAEMEGAFVYAVFGPVTRAVYMFLDADGAWSMCMGYEDSQQPEATKAGHRYYSSLYGIGRPGPENAATAALFRTAVRLFGELVDLPRFAPSARPGVAAPSATAVVDPGAMLDEAIVLDDEARERVERMIARFRAENGKPLHTMLICGPAGTGKTLLARTLARACEAKVHALATQFEKCDRHIAETFAAAAASRRAVVLLDNVAQLFVDRSERALDSWVAAAVGALDAQLDAAAEGRSRVLVVLIAEDTAGLDPEILTRFSTEIVRLGRPDAKARARIAEIALRKSGYAGDVDSAWAEGDWSRDLRGRDIAAVVRKAADDATPDEPFATVLDAAARRLRVERSTRTEAATWETLVLPQETTETLRGVARRWRHAEALRARGFTIPKAVLLQGPPGTGKTQIARTLACELGLAFFGTGAGDLLGRWSGQSAPLVRGFFARAAAQTPSIVFLDEIDALGTKRGDRFSHDEALNQLLHEMDGLGTAERDVFVVAATNRAEALDPALLSRFGVRLDIDLPDEDGRRRLLAGMLGCLPLDVDLERYLPDLVSRTRGASGRDLRAMIAAIEDDAIDRALTLRTAEAATITSFDIESALRRTR